LVCNTMCDSLVGDAMLSSLPLFDIGVYAIYPVTGKPQI
jgi:hypothetical protein